MTKRLIYFTFAISVIIGGTAIASCKKGENDPFLSLRSRRARITGEWKLKEGVETSQSNFGGTQESETINYTETTITTNGTSVSYTETLSIKEDGTFSMAVTENGESFTISGNWFFAGKIKDLDLKNKEAIILSTQESNEIGVTQSISGLLKGEPLIIDRLANDELIFKSEFSHDTGLGLYGSSSTFEKTFVKQ
jgi:hypothetical protein